MIIQYEVETKSPSHLKVKRPVPVTVIAWIEIVGGIVAQLVFAAAHFANPQHVGAIVHSKVPFGLQMAISEVGIIVMIASGVGMLLKLNWARYLYVAWAGLALARSVLLFYLTPQQLIIFTVGCAKYAVFVYFLTRPDSNRYFRIGGHAEVGSATH